MARRHVCEQEFGGGIFLTEMVPPFARLGIAGQRRYGQPADRVQVLSPSNDPDGLLRRKYGN